jgi:outer membrane protein assembly factor BamB
LRWEVTANLGWPSDVHLLPNGHILTAESLTQMVTERDSKGKILWQKKCKAGTYSCQRLPNGNTFIASGGTLIEVTRAGNTVSSITTPAVIYYAAKLRNGHILYEDSRHQVVELDAEGKELWSRNLPGSAWGSVEKLANGRYLVCLYSGGKVIELDTKGKMYWQCVTPSPVYATRLSNGRTLVGGAHMVVEFDRYGKEVWKQTTTGRVWRVRRY